VKQPNINQQINQATNQPKNQTTIWCNIPSAKYQIITEPEVYITAFKK
jgi:hypothetical protein